jgi:hypothetical protein
MLRGSERGRPDSRSGRLRPVVRGGGYASFLRTLAASAAISPCRPWSASSRPGRGAACHGADFRGTPLSRTAAQRALRSKTVPKGTPIGCYDCHNGPGGG